MTANSTPATSAFLPHTILSELMHISTEDLAVRPMMSRITEALAAQFHWEFVALASVDHRAGVFVCEAVHTELPTDIRPGYSRPLGSGIVGEVAASGTALLVSDASRHPNFVHTLSGGKSELCVPVLHRGDVLAVLNIESTRTHAFDDQLPMLEVIAGHIAGALAAARRVEELRRQGELLRIVAEFTRSALEAANLDDLLNHVLGFLSQRFNALEATVLLDSDLRDHLEVMAHHGASPHISYLGKQWPIDAGIVGRCYRSSEVVFVADVRKEPDYAVVNTAVVAEMAVPIRLRGRVFGVLNLEADNAAVFAEHERLIFTTLANQVAGAIHLFAINRRLLQSQQQSERRGEELTTAREHLRRAVVKLDRRALREQYAGSLTDAAMRRQLSADLRAVARGGRALMLILVNLPAGRMASEADWRDWIAAIADSLPDALLSGDAEKSALTISLSMSPESSLDDCRQRVREALRLADQAIAESDAVEEFDGRAQILLVPAGTASNATSLLTTITELAQTSQAADGQKITAAIHQALPIKSALRKRAAN